MAKLEIRSAGHRKTEIFIDGQPMRHVVHYQLESNFNANGGKPTFHISILVDELVVDHDEVGVAIDQMEAR
jgi:hypothetical protein